MKNYYVFQVEKFKSSDVVGVSKHNTRDFRNKSTMQSKNDNVDFTRTKSNLSFGAKDSKEFQERLESIIIKDNPKQKIKNNTNVFVDFVISASPCYFFDALNSEEKLKEWDGLNNSKEEDKKKIQEIWKSLNQDKFEAWKKAVLEFCNDEEFKGISVALDIHLDEKNVHAHCAFVPKVGNKVDCKHFYTPASLARWRAKLESKFTPLGLERAKETPGVRDDQEQHYKALANAVAEQPPSVQTPKRLTADDVYKEKKNFFGKTEKIQAVSTDEILRNVAEREKAQGKKYKFYKDFYEKNKYTALHAKKLENKNNALSKENTRINRQLKKFTDEQMENFRQVPLLEVLKSLGYEAKKEGNEFYRVKENNLNLVINIDKNQFSENGSSQNGFGSINLLVKVFGYSPKQAIEFLAGKYPADGIAQTLLASPNVAKDFINKTVHSINSEVPKSVEKNLPFVLDYLVNERGINRELVEKYAKDGLIYADAKRNLIITNADNSYAVVRGTVKLKDGSRNTFKCSKGKMDFIKFQNTENTEKIYVFESAIDALAFQTLNPEVKGLFVATNGSAMTNRLNELGLNKFKNVYSCFDKDEQGNKFSEKLQINTNKDQGFSVIQSKSKDFAEDSENSKTETHKNNAVGSKAVEKSTDDTSIGLSSLESIQIKIGSLENKLNALGLKLNEVPVEQRAEIERQIAEIRIQLMRLQQQEIEEEKSQLNKMKI